MTNDIFGNHGIKIRLPDTTYWAQNTPLTLDCTMDDEFLITDDGTNPVARNFSIDFSNYAIGKEFIVKVTADGTNRTIGFGSSIVAASGSLVLNASKSIILCFKQFNGKMCLMSQSVQF